MREHEPSMMVVAIMFLGRLGQVRIAGTTVLRLLLGHQS
jgi:hypothetical protein